MAEEERNGHTLRYRVERLEHRAKNMEEGARLLSQFGERNNTQIKVHDSQIAQLHEELHDVRVAAKEVPVLKAELASVVDTLRAARNAFFALGGGCVLLAITIYANP